MKKIIKIWIYILFLISIITLISIIYKNFFLFNIEMTDPLTIIQNTIGNKSEYDVNKNELRLIDKYELKYGLIILFETEDKSKPIGCITLEKNAIFNRYKVNNYKLYNNYRDLNKHVSLLKTYDNIYTYEVVQGKIKLLSSESVLIRSIFIIFVSPIILIIAIIYMKKTYIGKI